MDFQSLVHNPYVVAGACWIFSAAIQAMPEPTTASSQFYRWMYGFTHLLGANLKQVNGAITPPLKWSR
jgi:hypothetical protein